MLSKNLSNIDLSKDIQGELISSCLSNRYTFILKEENIAKKRGNLNYYSIILCSLCLAALINSIYLTLKLYLNETYAKSFALSSIFVNTINDSAGCLINFFFLLNYPKYFNQFLFTTVFLFLNFSVTDLRLLYTVSFIKFKTYIHDQIYLKNKIIKLYALLFCLAFFPMLYIKKMVFNKFFLIFNVIISWLPQIIYNMYSRNNVSYPFIYIIFLSLYRLFTPIYFRGYQCNFLMIEPDYGFIFNIVMIDIFMVLLYYSQIIFGPRWFLPERFILSETDCKYRNYSDLITNNEIIYKNECVICLDKLLIEEDKRVFTYDFSSNCNNETRRFERETRKFIKEFINILIDFHQKMISFNDKKYVITPCKHIFHSQCLHNWFLRKKECPICRGQVNIDYSYI